MRSHQRVSLDIEGLFHDDPLHDLVAGRGGQGTSVVVESSQVTETKSLGFRSGLRLKSLLTILIFGYKL